MARRAVVTGLGAVTPLGWSMAETWDGLRTGRRAFSPPELDGSLFRCGAFARVPRRPAPPMPRRERFDPIVEFALAAACSAWRDARLPPDDDARRRRACVLGVGAGGEETHDRALKRIYSDGSERLPPMTLPNVMVSAAASRIAAHLGLRGANFTVSSACASGLHALIQGVGLVLSGQADVVVTGGAEAPFALGALRSWEALRVMSPTRSAPFSADRDGMTLAEGAAVLVVEEEAHARERGASPYAEVLGCGMTCDAADMLSPDPVGMADAMRLALDASGGAAAPDAVLAHGTATRANDEAEAEALLSIFGRKAMPAVHCLKGHVGHMLGAAGALNAAVAARAVRSGFVPGDRVTPGGPSSFDASEDSGRGGPPSRFSVLANAFAFGGLNAAVLMATPAATSAGEPA